MSRLGASLRRLSRFAGSLLSSVTDLKLFWLGVKRKTRDEIRSLASEQVVLTPRDCALILTLDEEAVLRLLESGEMSGLLIGAQWRVTPDALRSFISSKQVETRLAMLRRDLDDPERWASAFWEDEDEARRILADQFDEGTFGKFIQDALRSYPPPQDD